ncbi:MAG: VOC family protein [Chitinophagaceae bacterium]
MRVLTTIAFALILFSAKAQDGLQYAGKQFFAISVANTSATSKWYEEVFQMNLLKEIRTPDSRVHIRIIGNDFLKIEILQTRNSKSIADLNIKNEQAFTVQGLFKIGFYVNDIARADAYFRDKKVVIQHEIFEDQETRSKSLIIQDLNGLMIQVMQEIK